jgi:hypothetical protein
MMDYSSITDPVFASADGKTIHCLVQFVEFAVPVPFLATDADPVDHGRKIYADLVAGTFGEIGAYVAAALSPAQQYAAAMDRGIVVTYAATPVLNGTYGVMDADMSNISDEAQFVALYQEFINGDTTLSWVDVGGQPHVFPDTATFMAFAKAAAKYVSGCKKALIALDAGNAAAFPSNEVRL